MPSASVKLENQGSQEALDPFHKVMNLVEKKIRNLEKRKNKLEQYRVDLRAGKELNEDQQQAVNNYDSVQANLDLVRELSHQFSTIQAEHLKHLKKQMKREQVEKQQEEITKVKDILKVQDILHNMSLEEFRVDFIAGTNGAVQISQEKLESLDLLYKLITPTRAVGQTLEDFQGDLKGPAEHLMYLMEARNKEVANSTYKDLLSLVEEIASCPYPETKPVAPLDPAMTSASQEDVPEYTNGLPAEECEETAPEVSVTCPITDGPPPGLAPAMVAPLLSPTLSQEPTPSVPAPSPPSAPATVPSPPQDALVAAMAQITTAGVTGAPQGAAGLPPAPSYFTQALPPPQPVPQPQPPQPAPPQPQQQQPPQPAPLQPPPPPPPPQLQPISLNDLVPPGNFDFLQESQVAQEPPTVYMDPAVVSIGSIKTEPVTQRSVSPVTQPPQPVAPLVPPPSQEPPHPSTIPTQTFTNQNFNVGPYPQGAPVYPNNNTVDSTPNPPPPIPLPPQTRPREKVEFNPEARPWTGPQQVNPQQTSPNLANVQQPPPPPPQQQSQPQPPSQPAKDDEWGTFPVNGWEWDENWGGQEGGNNWGEEYDEGQGGNNAPNGHGDYERRGGYRSRGRGGFGGRGSGFRGNRGNYQNSGRGFGGYGGYRGSRGGMVNGPRGGRGFRGQGPRGNFRSRGGGGYQARQNYQQQQQQQQQ